MYNQWTMQKSLNLLPYLLDLFESTHSALGDLEDAWLEHKGVKMNLLADDETLNSEAIEQMLKEPCLDDFLMGTKSVTLRLSTGWYFYIGFLDEYGAPPIVMYSQSGL